MLGLYFKGSIIERNFDFREWLSYMYLEWISI